MEGGEIERRILDIEKRLSILESSIKAAPSVAVEKTPSVLEEKLPALVDDMGTQDLVLIALRLRNALTKEEIKKTLGDWGKAYGDWFTGGNFRSRLIGRGLVKLEDKKKNDQDAFSLTKKGEKVVDELIANISQEQ